MSKAIPRQRPIDLGIPLKLRVNPCHTVKNDGVSGIKGIKNVFGIDVAAKPTLRRLGVPPGKSFQERLSQNLYQKERKGI
jgi:hypothetical protein